MKDLKEIIAKKDKLLSDCVESKGVGWLPSFHSSYHLHLTPDFKRISQLEGVHLIHALQAYRQHPASIRDPNPEWIPEASALAGFFMLAYTLGFFMDHWTIKSAPLVLIGGIFYFLGVYGATQDSLDFTLHWLRGERTVTSWNNKYSRGHIKFSLLESLSQLQQHPLLILLSDSDHQICHYLYSSLYNLIERPKRMISSRMPEHELKAIDEIKNFEKRVNALVKNEVDRRENRRARQSWCEWFSCAFLFRNPRVQQQAPAQHARALPEDLKRTR